MASFGYDPHFTWLETRDLLEQWSKQQAILELNIDFGSVCGTMPVKISALNGYMLLLRIVIPTGHPALEDEITIDLARGQYEYSTSDEAENPVYDPDYAVLHVGFSDCERVLLSVHIPRRRS